MIQYEEHYISYGNDKHLFYLATGPASGPLFVLMHGWPGIGKTWHPQLDAFASLGFRVIAPDMPGYGQSTALNVITDYSQENIVKAMLAVLADAGRDKAIWLGHDWGCGTLWTLANTEPQVVTAAIGLCVPFYTVEMGLDELLYSIDRDVYPEDQYPYGQWGYQVFYEQYFDKATDFFNKDVHGFLKAINVVGSPANVGKPSKMLANAMKEGWFGGAESPPAPDQTPNDKLNMDPGVFKELVAAMEKTGFGPADSWYMNHKANRAYNVANTKNDMKLAMPVLFIHARYDSVCETVKGTLAKKMQENCSNLTEAIINAGHWVAAERPGETNAAIARWLVEEVSDCWPGGAKDYWVKRKGIAEQRV